MLKIIWRVVRWTFRTPRNFFIGCVIFILSQFALIGVFGGGEEVMAPIGGLLIIIVFLVVIVPKIMRGKF